MEDNLNRAEESKTKMTTRRTIVQERVPIASHREYTYKTNIFIHNSLIASRHRTVVASRNRTVGRARARIFTRLLKALFGGNYHAEHLSGGGADPDLMSATHCGEKI